MKIKYYLLAVLALLILNAKPVLASEVTGTLKTDFGATVDGAITGTVIMVPSASPIPGIYKSGQDIVLIATNASSIRYTTDGTTPNCSYGNVYSGAIIVKKTETIKAVSCYGQNIASPIAELIYNIKSSSTGGGGGGGQGGTSGKSSIAATISVSKVAGASTAKLSIAEMEALIVELKKQIQVVIEKLAQQGIPPYATASLVNTDRKLTQDLSYGQRNEQIKLVQEMLAKLPGIYPQGLITGYFGDFTKAAVIRYQPNNGLPVTGIIDLATREKLNLFFIK